MARGRWKKYHEINQYIIQILKHNLEHLTTNEIKRRLLEKYNVRIGWPTINKYLNELASAGHVKGISVDKKNQFHIWTLKGVSDGATEQNNNGSQACGNSVDEQPLSE